jgi:hypothetical protein
MAVEFDGHIKAQYITLRVQFDDCSAPPSEWNWNIMGELTEQEEIEVVFSGMVFDPKDIKNG